MNSNASALEFLRRQQRLYQGTLAIWASAYVLAFFAWYRAGRVGWLDWAPVTAGVAAIVGAISLGLLGREVQWAKRLAVARALDRQLGLQSRLESVVELSVRPSGLALAQKDEADSRIRGQKLCGRPLWLGGIAASGIALAMIGAEYFPVFSGGGSAPSRPGASVVIAAPEPLRVSFTWISPDKIITSPPAANIPLEVMLMSNRPMGTVVLKTEVNGLGRTSDPLDLAQAATGDHRLRASLALAAVRARPADIVSYYLEGIPKDSTGAEPVVSLLQFVEIVEPSAHDSVQRLRDPGAMSLAAQLEEIGRLQRGLIEDEFVLRHAHEQGAGSAAARARTRFANRQRDLEQKLRDLKGVALRRGSNPIAQREMDRAATHMADAAKELAVSSTDAGSVLPYQALSRLARARNALLKSDRPQEGQRAAASPLESNSPLPFRDTTFMGRLEDLARRQKLANQRMLDPSAPTQTAAVEAQDDQARVGLEAQKLGEETYSALGSKELAAAGRAAAEAARQLGLQDKAAARQAGAEAEDALDKAIATQRQEGVDDAVSTLEQARQILNQAARMSDPSEQRAQLAKIQRALQSQAVRQQQEGSSDAAQKMEELAGELAESQDQPKPSKAQLKLPPKGAPPLMKDPAEIAESGPGSTSSQAGESGQPNPAGSGSPRSPTKNPQRFQSQISKPHQLAAESAKAQLALAPKKSMSSAARQLRSAAAKLQNRTPADAGDAAMGADNVAQQLEGIESAAQLAQAAAGASAGLADQLLDGIGETFQARAQLGEAQIQAIAQQSEALAAELEKAAGGSEQEPEVSLPSTARGEQVQIYSPEDLDPNYRKSVANYFVLLSRQHKPR